MKELKIGNIFLQILNAPYKTAIKIYNFPLNWYMTNKWHILYQLRNEVRAVVWTPEHAGITNTGNEKADLLPKELPDLQRITQYAIPTMANALKKKTKLRGL
jgi:hypothetical protein